VKALLIPPARTDPAGRASGLADLQRLIEGPIEALPVPGYADAAAYVNEEGLLEGLPANARATQLLGIQIVGPAVLCGFDTATGEQTPIPDDLAQAALALSDSSED
jgi:hypothetical protein